MGKKLSGEVAHGLGDQRGHPLLLCPSESTVAVGRFRPGAASVYFVRDDKGGGSVVLSAYPTRIDCTKTAASWLVFGRDLRDYTVVGYRVAASFIPDGSSFGDHLVPRGECCLWSGRSLDRPWCLWPESDECAPCDFGTHGHAARVGDLSGRTFDLAKNSRPRAVAAARAMGNVRSAHRFHVHQGADRVRVFASRHRAVSMARQRIENGECVVWLVAMDCVSGLVFDMGNLRRQVGPGLL